MIGIAAGLAFCFACIFVGGGFLTSIGDRIASRTALGHHLMGMLFLAAVTSLPELAAGISAAGVSGEADIAYGEVVGSCVFNLTILGVADLISRTPVISARGHGLYLNGATGIALLATAAVGLLVSDASGRLAALFNLIIVGIYLAGLEGARRAERDEPEPAAEDGSSSLRLWLLFGVTSLLVIGPGLWLPILADALAEQSGVSHSFVGTFLVGAVTSAPEAIVTYHCVKRGWGAMAVGNLLGSNLFNILILVPMDLVYRSGSLYEAAGSEHAVTALLAIIMTAVVLAAASWRRRQEPPARRRPEGWILVLLYMVALLCLAPGIGLG